jgi:hypothetical protein
MPPSVPTVTTPVPTPFEVRLEGAVNPDNEPTTCVFEYGETTAYGSSVPCEQGTLEGYEEQGQGVSANVSHLTPGTTYYFRLRGTNQTGESSEGEGTGEFTPRRRASNRERSTPPRSPRTRRRSKLSSTRTTRRRSTPSNTRRARPAKRSKVRSRRSGTRAASLRSPAPRVRASSRGRCSRRAPPTTTVP